MKLIGPSIFTNLLHSGDLLISATIGRESYSKVTRTSKFMLLLSVSNNSRDQITGKVMSLAFPNQ